MNYVTPTTCTLSTVAYSQLCYLRLFLFANCVTRLESSHTAALVCSEIEALHHSRWHREQKHVKTKVLEPDLFECFWLNLEQFQRGRLV